MLKNLPHEGSSIDTKLDAIVMHLERMDKRDRLRTYGGFVRTVIGLIPMIAFVLSLWYVYTNGDDLLKKVTEEAAKQAASITEKGTSNFMKKFVK